MKYALEVKNITKRYERFTLDQVSFAVPGGSIMGFVGENGAGKSTTIKGILGLIRLDEGEVRILGKDQSEEKALDKEEIGVVLDGCHFPDNLKVKEVRKIMRSLYRSWQDDVFAGYLKQFQLEENKKVKELSRGMKMKLSLAIALSHQAKLLILDEPTSGLDPMARDAILDIFLDFIQDEEHSILVSSHIITDLEKVADYITFIHQGKLLFSESKDELLLRYGLVRCTKEELKELDERHIRGIRRNHFGCEVLVDNRPELEKREHSYVLDPANIEEIMLFLADGR